MTELEKINELKEFYSESELNIMLSAQNIIDLFNDHVSKHAKDIEIYDLFKDDNYINNGILINTPDGFQEIGDFYRKSPRLCYSLETENGHTLSGSCDHLVEVNTSNNWIKSENLKIGDNIITLDGPSKLYKMVELDKQEVFDFEVLHDKHRYWGGSGISSHNTGKTFLCLNAIKNAQDMGYAIFYIDTEGALDKKDFINFGINMDLLNYKRIGIISEVKFYVHDIIKMVEENPGLKIMIIVDSLTHLETNKEVEDRAKGSNAQDMGLRAKELRQLFKSFTLDLSNLKIPLIFTSHTYACFPEDQLVSTDNGNTKIVDLQIGDLVNTLDGLKPVENIFTYDNADLLEFEFEDGSIIRCTPNHRFLIGSDWNDDSSWVEARDLVEGANIICK